MLYEYARIKANALTDGLIRYENGQVYNTNKQESPYQSEFVFAGSCLETSTQQSNVTFSLPSALFLTNCKIKNLEIDFGTGFKNINPDKKVNANLKTGINKVIIRATLQDGQILSAHTIIQVENLVSEIQTRAITNKDSLIAHYSTTIQDQNYRGISTSAEVTISYAPGNYSLRKPLIIVEGFDPRVDAATPKGSWNFNRIKRESNIIALNKIYGYDIVYVDWVKSQEYIQANSYTLKSVIEWINSNKIGNETNVIVGHSMGRLIARYALKTMENQGVRHQVSTYVSYDSPHLGAHVPLGVLYAFHGILSFLEGHSVMDALINTFTPANAYIGLGKSMAYSTAAQQMLVHYVDPAGNYNKQEHIQWQNELKTLGFPKGDLGTSFKMLAVSNGSYSQVSVPPYYLQTSFSAGTDIGSTFLPRVLGLAVGIGLNDIVAGLLTVLPGRTSINGSFDIYPAHASGDLVTRIRLQYKKTFLWIVPISKNLFSYDKNYQGGLFYDTYPSSSYALIQDDQGLPITEKDKMGIPLIFDFGYDVKLSPRIPFVPNSSALAYGDGINIIPANFLSPPHGTSSPFGENYYTHSTTRSHSFFTDDALIWMIQRLSTSIVGPKVGTNGAQYSLSNTTGSVTWSSSNTSIATINSSGVLTVNGTGIITLTAKHGGNTYSQMIMVGMPRYILTASHEPGGYEINAECIDNQFKDYLSNLNGVLTYNWGVKYPSREIRWLEADVPSLKIDLRGQNERVIVYLEVIDALGNKSALQHIEINSQDVYVAENQNLYIDAQGVLYKENKTKYLYNSARLYISYRANIPDKYKEREWMATTTMVLKPFSVTSVVDARSGGPLIKNILPQDELDYIKNNSTNNQVYRYTLILLNYSSRAIQFVPVTFTYVTNI
jgi:pimeloyl-ACP methyl ester carboxylesterase